MLVLLFALGAGLLAGCGRDRPAAVTFGAKDADFRAVFPVTPARSVKTVTPSGASVDAPFTAGNLGVPGVYTM